MTGRFYFRLLCVAAAAATVSLSLAAKPTPTSTPKSISKKVCPLPEDYLITSTSASSTNSPEKGPGPLSAVCHNGKILCLPPHAYKAHIQHGDTPAAYTCTKEGNQGPCP
jgi:hypothetical protein